MANNNQYVVPQARQGLQSLKQQVASQVGVNLQGYNGDLPAREAGRIGGQMVRHMIAQAQQQLAGGAGGAAAFPATTTTRGTTR
jgi:hypothetical protein